jgi:hypothetical protein
VAVFGASQMRKDLAAKAEALALKELEELLARFGDDLELLRSTAGERAIAKLRSTHVTQRGCPLMIQHRPATQSLAKAKTVNP